MEHAGQLHNRGDRHADHVLEVVHRSFDEAGDDLVTRSWRRCLNQYQLDPGRPREPVMIGSAALQSRREQRADVIECARYEMSTLYQQLADPDSAVLLTDMDGVIVHMVSSPEFAATVESMGLRLGGVWGEAEAGTNGMGTCLAAAHPVSVQREEHFFSRFTQLTCSAVPVFDPCGDIVAALDVTSRSHLMQQHLLVLLGMTARMIENRLIDKRFSDAHPLHFHSRPEFVYTLHEGKLAVSADGLVLAANRSALFQLGFQSMDDIRCRRIDELFQTSLEDILQRSLSASFHPVAAYRAHAALRFFAVARRPAADAARALSARTAGEGLRAPERASTRAAPSVCTFKDERLIARLDTARRVIARRTPVLLCGETGSGKEVFARAIHDGSPHAEGAFVAVNCASLPETLIESELFGYRAGAFTGAQRNGRRGKILQADSGTLFLDEIADMPLELQARLLRVLDERRVTPLGTEETYPVNFQLVSASHRHLPSLVREGRFREDLYYRLAGIELDLPALRERTDRRELIRDILMDEAGGACRLGAAAERLLMGHPWPGNLRQLRHVLRSAAALADGQTITPEHLPSLSAHPAPAEAAPASGLNPIQANERKALLQMLEEHRWNVSHVAKALEISRNTLYRKLRRLHIEISAHA
ncbi:sigma-54-dependent Fis family transcriptional regulator [Verminephrobacter aporrectodeae subsp. tuberculatae]|uniref:Sigma-54-dependent Fis family transcriptional regulator n=1 Tax=Verminephrobacter aporrectodeae subsp. tuberculatae TaxID=1110392 RepID=A0ABT3KWA4_9BURK|nr:sigma-54-dependent Fis family transcriptional regulator [Verminephrobacter aporrectodeae]MCW5322634.1 sigma-54-dependent Fis family transcriptional regulator [Verminephrobacter aporrectodeae subsp. tuberculatae]MCW8200631.1 sigma-54-dependent Fis family transcriptional regulator [Verminephrobacter aporrectodeae subsp. tuberculatae]